MRIVIYANDIVEMLGCSENQARKILRKVRKELGKAPRSYISIAEFAYCLDLPLGEIQEYMKKQS